MSESGIQMEKPKSKKDKNWPAVLKAWRKRRGFTQTKAAEFFGVGLRAYQHWEGARRRFATSDPQTVRDLFL
jgi:transcriptional regulator with XRE-family HTH domain